MTLAFVALDVVRLTTAVMALIVAILLPSALQLRIKVTKYGWILVLAIEIALIENVITTISRLGHPWSWLFSPFLMLQSILAFIWILLADKDLGQ